MGQNPNNKKSNSSQHSICPRCGNDAVYTKYYQGTSKGRFVFNCSSCGMVTKTGKQV